MPCPVPLVAVALLAAADPEPLSAVHRALVRHVDDNRPELIRANQDIWTYAEVGLEEHRSAARLVGLLKKAGFRVAEGVSGMPTAFVAEYGSGKPVVGILAEYDALPGLSQDAVGFRKPALPGGAGHGCGHSAFGVASVGAALAVRAAYDEHKLPGTVRVYGCPAEETLIGKVYLALDDKFADLDVCLHWHPGNKTRSHYHLSKALISAKFTFRGTASHAGGSPDKGRSALDAVELMNVGTNYMREHVKESTRVHYVVTNGGGQPNVVPAEAQVWYYVRANTHEDCGKVFDWVREIADGAAKMTRTKVEVTIDTDCHEVIPNLPLAKLIDKNLRRIGPPAFDDADRALARELRASVGAALGGADDKGDPLAVGIDDLPAKPEPPEGGSTDVGDVSWLVPVGGLNAACSAAGTPGHSWQVVAATGSPIAHKGLVVAAKALALTAADLLTDANLLKESRADFDQRMAGKSYTSRVPKGQKPPARIR